jgi:hypothetical protein
LANGLNNQGRLHDQSILPPPTVMICVASKGYGSDYETNILRSGLNGTDTGIIQDSDGTVAYKDQFIDGYPTYTVTGVMHSDITNEVGKTGLLSFLAFQWEPTVPPTPSMLDASPPPSKLLGTPLYVLPFLGQNPNNAPLGRPGASWSIDP